VVYLLSALGLISLAVAGYAVMQLRQLQERLRLALGGIDTDSLELTLGRYLSQVETVDSRLVVLNEKYERLAVMTSLASQKISLVRFNPFGDTGGDQSFSLAILDAHDSGYVLTSIHGREGTRVYVKPIDLGKSKYQLSQEEQQALSQASKRVPPEFKEI
jgi:hypothetical protein